MAFRLPLPGYAVLWHSENRLRTSQVDNVGSAPSVRYHTSPRHNKHRVCRLTLSNSRTMNHPHPMSSQEPCRSSAAGPTVSGLSSGAYPGHLASTSTCLSMSAYGALTFQDAPQVKYRHRHQQLTIPKTHRSKPTSRVRAQCSKEHTVIPCYIDIAARHGWRNRSLGT
jgi:hypothetical protein